MFIGNKNRINLKLVSEMNQLLPIQMVDYQKLLQHELLPEKASPKVIFVNLIDVGKQQGEVIKYLKEYYPNSKLIALHYYKTPSMIKDTLKEGFDGYLSIFHFSDRLIELFGQLAIKVPSQ